MKQVLRFLFLIPYLASLSFSPILSILKWVPLAFGFYLKCIDYIPRKHRLGRKLIKSFELTQCKKIYTKWVSIHRNLQLFQLWGTQCKILGCMSGSFGVKRDSLRCLLPKSLGTRRQWLVLVSNKMKAQISFVSIAEPMAIVDLLETIKKPCGCSYSSLHILKSSMACLVYQRSLVLKDPGHLGWDNHIQEYLPLNSKF